MNGILIVDKPQGPTSHDIVDFIRKKFCLKKVGHAGTLDPMATGVLVILLGQYTKRSNTFLNDDKEYDATMALGATSDTGDAWGKITEPAPRGSLGDLSEEKIRLAFEKFLGTIEQSPHPYSAVKLKGKKLYEFARKGIEVKAEPRKVTIKKLDITKLKIPEISFNVTCSKGTYIRKLCEDIGTLLGCGAYLSRLRRTRSGEFTVDKAVTFEELKSLDAQSLKDRMLVF